MLLVTLWVLLLLTLSQGSFLSLCNQRPCYTKWICILVTWRVWIVGWVGPGILHSHQAPRYHCCCWSTDHTLNSEVLGPLDYLSFCCCHSLRGKPKQSYSANFRKSSSQDNYSVALGLHPPSPPSPPSPPMFFYGARYAFLLLPVVVVLSGSPSEFRCSNEDEMYLRLVRHLLSDLFM